MGKFGPKKSKLSVLPENGHTENGEDADRDVSRGVLLLVNQHGIANLYPKLIKTKNLNVILNELFHNTLFPGRHTTSFRCWHDIIRCRATRYQPLNDVVFAKYLIITFSIVNNPYPCHPYMFMTENYSSKFTIISFWAPALLIMEFPKNLWICHWLILIPTLIS